MVSVIIPNYNHERFLNDRIESIINQTFQDFEIILLDDCSTDASKGIIELYRNHPKVSVIVYNEQNSGSTFKQWEKGFTYAKGEYIWIAESDDLAEPDFLKEVISVFYKDTTIGLVATNFLYIDSFNTKIRSNEYYKCYNLGFETYYKIEEGKEFLSNNMLIYNSLVNASGVVFKKEALNIINNNYKNFKLCGDWMFWNSILLNYKIGIIKNTLNLFREHPNSVRNTDKITNTIKEDYIVFNYFKNQMQLPSRVSDQVYALKFEGYKNYINNSTILFKSYLVSSFSKDPSVHKKIVIHIMDILKEDKRIIKMYFLWVAIKNKVRKYLP